MSEITSSDTRGGESQFKRETITTPDGAEVTFSPERGGIITSIKLKKGSEGPLTEILYLDEETYEDPSKNVKGGIPDLFPNAGPIREGRFAVLKQHGFARNRRDWMSEPTGDPRAFVEKLRSDEETKSVFPYDWQHRIAGQLKEDGSFALTQGVTNEGQESMPLSMGLHPYFRVDPEQKQNIIFDFSGGEEVEQQWETWANDGTVEIDNPKIKDPDAVMRVEMPGVGTLVLDVSAEYKRIWIWSMKGKGFVCIEPVMRDSGGLEKDPEMIAPGTSYEGRINIRLE